MPGSVDPYLPADEVLRVAASLGAPTVYGRSTEGRDLLAVDLGGSGSTVLVTAGIHGLEWIGVATALEVLRRGPLPGARLVVCPLLNPDGYAATGSGRRQRGNARGVDLNRNFPFPYGARPSWLSAFGAGSSRPGDATFRGEGPLSEPETRGLAELVAELRPVASANLHSFLGTLFCARVWHPGDWWTYDRLAAAFRRGQGPGIRYVRVGTPVGDVFTGELEDWQHHTMGCWAVCVECFAWSESFAQTRWTSDLFWRFNPRAPDPIASRDAGGVREMLALAATLDRPPLRPGAADTRPAW